MTRWTHSRPGVGPLVGAHRTTRDKTAKGGRYYIRWAAWRGKGAPTLATFSGNTEAEALAAEKAGAGLIADQYSEARSHAISGEKLAGLLDLYEASAEFKRCSQSTQRQRSALIKAMRDDPVPPPPGQPDTGQTLGNLPTKALASKRVVGTLTRWRDKVVLERGPSAADHRVQLLRTALAVLLDQGIAPANPAAKLGMVSNTDRSDLIWDPDMLKRCFASIKAKLAKAWAEKATVTVGRKVTLNHNRFAKIMALAAAHDALMLVVNNGMRREDLAHLNQRECTDVAFVYTARKGSRRARTAGKKPRTTIVPMLPDARRVVLRRLEAHGKESPWIIISSRGAHYSANTLGELVNAVARELEIERTLHDGKGTFVTRIKRDAPWMTDAEIGEMVDWSEDDVGEIIRRYVSHDEIAKAKIARLEDRRKSG